MSEDEGKHRPEHSHQPERNKEHFDLSKVHSESFTHNTHNDGYSQVEHTPANSTLDTVNLGKIEDLPHITQEVVKNASIDTAPKVHARFRLAEDTRVSGFSRQKKDGSGWEYVNGNRVKLYPVQGEPFGSATPSGELTMTIINPEATKVFTEAEIGQEYDVIFTPVAKQD